MKICTLQNAMYRFFFFKFQEIVSNTMIQEIMFRREMKRGGGVGPGRGNFDPFSPLPYAPHPVNPVLENLFIRHNNEF